MSVAKEIAGSLRLHKSGNGFSVYFREKLILRHTSGDPLVSVGVGRGRFRMSHGNFRISDRLAQRMSCSRFAIEGDGPEITVSFPQASLRVMLTEEPDRLIMRFVCEDGEVNRIWLRLCASPREHIYGCGEQYSRLDLKGSRVPLWVSEQGIGRGHNLLTLAANIHSGAGGSWYTTYFPVPAFLSSENWYCVCEVSGWSRFDFRSRDSTWLEFWEIPRRITIGFGGTAVATLSGMSRLVGRQPEPPEWISGGLWLGVQGGRRLIDEKLRDAIEAGVKVGCLWVQDWVGKRETSFGRQLRWNWDYDKAMYPDLPGQIHELNQRGIRFLGYINPFLSVEGNLYRDASRKGLCVKNRAGRDYLVTVTSFSAALLDLTNPEAMSWIKRIIRENLIGIGMAGWMADYGEYLPTDAVLFSGEPAELVHNRYPVLWAQANREAVEEAGKGRDVFFFMRSGYSGSTRYAGGYWAGDQMVDFSRHDGLPSVIPAAISLGMVSGGVWHAEIGGFTSLLGIKRTEEIFMRWAELALFSPIMRTHEGNRPDANWQFNSSRATLHHLAKMTRIYTALRPYHIAVGRDYLGTGLPPIRHPFLHYEEDNRLHHIRDQFLYGRDLMVAPIVRSRRSERAVYLPEDHWIQLWTGRAGTPGLQTVASPMGKPAVFYRAGSPFESLFRTIREGDQNGVFDPR